MAVIYPRFGQERQVAQELLALAKDPREVGTNTDNGFAFVVPHELWQEWLALNEKPVETQADVSKASRRPGRPRKVQEETENE